MAIVRRKRAEVDLDTIDWTKLRQTTDAEIAVQIAQDGDTAFTDAELAQAQLVHPGDAAREVRGLRERLGLSQAEFARRFGFSVDTIRNYEQGHRQPAGPARVLLRVIAAEPEAVTRALAR